MPIRLSDIDDVTGEIRPQRRGIRLSDIEAKQPTKRSYESILSEQIQIPAPIQSIREQIAQSLITPTMPFTKILPKQVMPQVTRGLETGALQAISAAGFGIPQFALHRAGYEIPQPQTPIETGVTIPLETIGSLMGISPFARGARMIPKIPAFARSAAALGGYGTTRAAFEGEPVIPSAISSVLMGGLGHLGARAGATIAPTTPIGQRIGSALGFGAMGAGVAGLSAPKEQRAQEMALQGLIGTGLGLMGKAEPFRGKQPAQYAKEAIADFRIMLKPKQGEIKNIEVRQRKDIDDAYRLAAEEQLPIKQSADKTLDTVLAIDQLKPNEEIIYNKMQQELKKDITKRFDLLGIGKKAKSELRKSIKDDTEYKSASKEVDEQIIDAIEERGRYLNGQELNDFKQGKWSVSYNIMKPTAQSTARKLGFIAKETIEEGYPQSKIKELNEVSGKYATLRHLLENAHGRVISGGLIGRYFARTIGTIAGAATKLPFGVGPFIGALGGEKISKYMTSPERISKIAGKKALKAGIVRQSFRNLPLPEKPISLINEILFPQFGQLQIPQAYRLEPLLLPSPETISARPMTKAKILKARQQLKEPIPERFRREVERERKAKELHWKSSGLFLPSSRKK